MAAEDNEGRLKKTTQKRKQKGTVTDAECEEQMMRDLQMKYAYILPRDSVVLY